MAPIPEASRANLACSRENESCDVCPADYDPNEPISPAGLMTLTPPNGLIEYMGEMCLSSTKDVVP